MRIDLRMLPALAFVVLLLNAGTIAASSEKAAEATASAAPAGTPSASPSVAVEKADAKKEKPALVGTTACLNDPTWLEDLRKRREEMEVKARELQAREAELVAREKAIDEEIRKLESLKGEIAIAQSSLSKNSEEKVAKLVETFETMSPKSAAQLLATVDEGLAIAAMSRMGTPKLAKIMNVMEPGKASRLAEFLSGLNRGKVVAPSKERQFASTGATGSEKASAKGGDKNDGHNDESVSSSAAAGSERR